MIDYEICGKNALVTGGSHGIGLAIAEALAREGVNVAICSRSVERLNKAKEYLTQFGTEIIALKFEALNANGPEEVSKFLLTQWTHIDILINNVGGGGRWGDENVLETADSVWSEVFQKNALCAAYFIKHVLSGMIKNKWGRVVCITSLFGKEGGGRPWFSMAKSAEVALMKSLSLDKNLVRNGITFNSVAPGGIAIPGTGYEIERNNNPLAFETMIDRDYPMGRMGTPKEVANIVCFLSSNLASFINGSQITVDGGQSRSF
jgi:3-oxoacyl-[acyl-carrier protein] reductase